jgi:shikimate dehydrogenase
MPFKEACIEHVDVVHPSASAIDSVNTIVNEDGELHAYNTDYQAVADLLRRAELSPDLTVAVSGSGGMAKAVVAALRDSGFETVDVVARNRETGSALAQTYGFEWRPDLGDARPQLLVNATPIGMTGGPESDALPFPEDAVDAAEAVFDVVAMPPDTPLVRAATAGEKTVVTGAQVIALQAAEQFVLYTDVRPTDDQVRRASEFSRA